MNIIVSFLLSLVCGVFGFCSGDSCKEMVHAEVAHVVCRYSVDEISVELFLNDEQDQPYARLARLAGKLDRQPLMLMNGGMYHEDLRAVGLYVERGQERQKISTKDGWGNFHLLPNGVFWIRDGKVGVTETGKFIKRGLKPEFATQSGPMLVIDGKLHPRFLVDSDSRKIRNGVGVSKDGKELYFAISRQPVTFWEFGKLFQTQLNTPNALYLDGTVSSIQTSGYRLGGWRELGPIIGVFERRR